MSMDLLIKMAADTRQLRADMETAKGLVERSAMSMKTAANMAAGALGLIGGALSAGAFASWIKGAIDAADEASKLAKSAGIATQDVAGLQLAFKLGGPGADAMGGAMSKLSKQVADGAAVFDSLGIKTRNADGSLRSTKDVLYDTADAFKGMGSGTLATSKAMEIFGKSGGDMVPMLLEGRDGLKAMADNAEKLGLVMSAEAGAAAEEFNDTLDLLGASTQGVANQVMGEILPTMNALGKAFLSSATDSDYLQRLAGQLGWALSGLAKVAGTLGLGVMEVFSTLVKGIGGAAAMVVQFVSGDFAGAVATGKMLASDIAGDWKKLGSTVVDVWTGAGKNTVAQAETMSGAVRGATKTTKDYEEATKAAGKASKEEAAAKKLHADEARKMVNEHEKLIDSYVKLTRASAEKLAQQQYELDGGRKLSDSEKDYVKVLRDVQDGKVRMTELLENGTIARLQENMSVERSIAVTQEEEKWITETAKANRDAADARQEQIAALREDIKKGEEHFAVMGLNVQQLAAREAGFLRNAAAAKLKLAVEADLIEANGKTSDQYREQARLLNVLAEQADRAPMVQAAKDAAVEWTKLTDGISQGLTDSLFRAFESGKDFFSTFWSGIKNVFKTTVLQMVIQPVQRAVAGAVGSAFSSFASAGNGGGSDLVSNLGTLSSLVGTLGTATTALSTGFGAGLAGTLSGAGAATFGAGASLAGAGAGAGSLVGASAGVSTMVGAAIPYVAAVLAVVALYKSLRTKATPHMGSVVGVGADGQASTLYGDASQILNNYNAETDDALRGLGGISTTGLNELSKGFGGQGGFAATLKFAADGKDASIGSFGLSQAGRQVSEFGITSDYNKYAPDREAALASYTSDVARATRDAVDSIDLPEWAREKFAALGDAATIEEFAKTVAKVLELQAAMASLRDALTPLGGVFGRVATLSGDALAELIGFSGGIEAFSDKVRGFAADYFTQAEQSGIAAGEILRTLNAAGIDASALTDRASFRATVESQANNIDTTEGRAQLAALLDVSKSFATLADYLRDAGLTLGDAAKLAPGGVLADTAAISSDATTAAVDSVAEGIASSNQVLATIAATSKAAEETAAATAEATAELATSTESANLALLARIEALQSALTTALAPLGRVAESSLQTAEQLRRWDDGDALNARVAT